MPTQGSNSSDYFDDDPQFLHALGEAALDELNGDMPSDAHSGDLTNARRQSRKRSRSPDDSSQSSEFHQVLKSVHSGADPQSYLSSNTYGASRFGGFGEYMSRKRAKLQIQNAELETPEDESGRIFKGLQIYINGWTEPSVQDLRALIIRHGGIYHPYLDKKSLVTHIVTCSLTPAKVREFKHMKVATPEWLVESEKAGQLLSWQDFVFRPGERVERSQGRKVAQKSLFEGFASQASGLSAASRSAKPALQPDHPVLQEPIDLEDGPVAVPTRFADAGSASPKTPTEKDRDHILPSHTLYTIDQSPTSPKQEDSMSSYAAFKSNPNAQRVMADPAWRAAHTSVAPDFIEGYYKNSRLHHLSMWKAELKQLVAQAQEHVENGGGSTWDQYTIVGDSAVCKIVQQNMDGRTHCLRPDDVSMKGAQLPRFSSKGKAKAVDPEDRVIMHCDFDSFFVAAGLIERPHLREKPVVVCHSQGTQGRESSTSEIASASYEARKFGIKNGMSLQQARKLCPTLVTMPYEFQKYKQYSLQFYTILMAHADDLQAVSVDEALIDVTSSIARIRTELEQNDDSSSSPADPAKEFAEAIRAQVKNATGCETVVSIGVSHNIMMARIASRKAKPAGSCHIFPHDIPAVLEPLDVRDLHGFGYSARQKALEKLGTTTLGELAKKSKVALCEVLGKSNGETLYKAIRGIDERKLESDKPRKSVSCDINYGIRFENNAQAEAFIYQMAEEVARRLDSIDMCGRSLTLKVMKRDPSAPVEAPKFLGHGVCETFNKQIALMAPGGRPTSDAKIIGEHAWKLLKGLDFNPRELRGIAIQIQKLEKSSGPAVGGAGQALLPFKPKVSSEPVEPRQDNDSRVEVHPDIVIQPPSQDGIEPMLDDVHPAGKPPAADAFDPPSFSQVDKSVLEVLPDDIRKELETEYNRRSTTPTLGVGKSRSPSLPTEYRKKITVKGTTASTAAKPNVKRITQQLAPRNAPSISPKKSSLFANFAAAGPSSIKVSEWELRKLGIDPEVFNMLPVDLQREQLSVARHAKAPGVSVYQERKVLKPKSRSGSPIAYYRAPAPQAKYLEAPALKQAGKTKGEKLHFTETEDLQRVIEAWVAGFTEVPPNQRDVDYFAKFLVQCVDGTRSADTGLERAVAVAKWWLILLRRHFGIWEHAQDDSEPPAGTQVTSEVIGRAWWKAFRDVKCKMDAVARKKFGGTLSLR